MSVAAIRHPVNAATFGTAAAPAASAGAGDIAPIFTPEIRYWAGSIVAWAAAAGLDPNLAATVMQIESCGDPRATSRSGAIGLFQVMPYHFASADSPYLPETNARRGLAYLKRALESADGDANLAFAGYNGGIGVIARGEWTWPDETRRYVYWASGIYADAISGAQTSARLDEWFATAGASMCRGARARLGLDG
ncbi:MAG TPA: transglycosylase SLT domain-containing protein [Anaerolineales bacterium]